MPRAIVLAALLAATAGCIRPGLPGCDGERVARGRALFVHHGCHGCHTVRAMGTPIGPDLSDIGTRHRAAWLARWMRDPSAQRPLAHMPPIAMPPDDADAVAAWLSTMR